jgi:N-dimethylarginine dimethylaminohydrolase
MTEPLRFLMCEPRHFEVSYVINPWMEGNINQTRLARATRQWQRLAGLIADRARIERVVPHPGLPDMPFTANAGLILENVAVLSRFRYAERQGEERHFEHWFTKHGFTVLKMPADVPFEGAGDALLDRGAARVWAAWGHRSARASHVLLRRMLGAEVISVRLVDRRFYHLDTCFCPLEGGHVLYYPAAFDAQSKRTIERLVSPALRIAVDEVDALNFVCNAVNIGDAVIVNRASARLRKRLRAIGYDVIETELTEFLKAGGAAKCLTLRLDEPRYGAAEQKTA